MTNKTAPVETHALLVALFLINVNILTCLNKFMEGLTEIMINLIYHLVTFYSAAI